MKYLRIIFELVKETAVSFGRDKGPLLAAALAYHTIFSLAPLLVVAVAVAGFVFGEAAVRGELVGLIEGAVGTDAAVVIQNLISSASQSSGEIFATVISTVLLFFGASGVFGQLKNALNMIWGIARGPDQGILALIKTRFLAILMVMGIGFLLLTAVAANTILTALSIIHPGRTRPRTGPPGSFSTSVLFIGNSANCQAGSRPVERFITTGKTHCRCNDLRFPTAVRIADTLPVRVLKNADGSAM